MGVKGLLPLLRSIHKPCNLKQFSGKTLGVDAYGWLHRGTISCAIELAQGKPTTKFVDFVMHRVRMLIHFGVTPLLVFDGDYLPSKKQTEKDRAAKRRGAKSAGLELLQMGKTAQAYQELQKGIDVTPEMARQLMDELDKEKVNFLVAPFEADSQLVYLEKKGVIEGILSEDSDMLVFGAKTLLTKLDQYGDCVAIHRKDFTACKEISLVGWSDDEFRCMSILSGCDYLAPIGNVGLKTAYRLIRKHKTVDRIVKALQFDGKSKVPQGYLDDFRTAESTFLYQWVYCPEAKGLVNITEPPADVDVSSMAFIGRKVEDRIAQKVAHGKLHPHTKEPLFATPAPPPRQFRTLEKAMQQTRTPELKKHHSIESFFKPKRTPLAELDPNCFTPSPSQQRLLEQQQEERTEWNAASAPMRPPILARAVTDVRSQSARRAVADTLPSPGQTSPKRQRLCSDSGIAFTATPATKIITGQSRFFSTSAASYQSPSALKAGRKKSGKKSEFDVFSDDSIEDAFDQVIEASTKPTVKPTKKKLAVFREDSKSGVEEPPVGSTSDSQSAQDTQSTSASIEPITWSQDANHGDSTVTSFDASVDDYALESKKPDLVEKDNIKSGPDRVPCSSPPKPETDEIDDVDWHIACSRPLKPLASNRDAAISASAAVQSGSEDLIVPNSDSEEDDVKGSVMPKFGLDLGKFAFAG